MNRNDDTTTPRPAGGHRIAAFFDLDKTIIATSSVFAFNQSFVSEGLMTRGSIAKLAYSQLAFSLTDADDEQMDRVRENLADATRGWLPEQVEQIVTEALSEIIRPTVFREAQELMSEHRGLGHDLVILSASGEELIAPIARMLGVDHYAGTRMKLGEDGRYAGEIDFYCQGPGKVEAMRAFARRYGYDLSACHAYSDSATDLPMLEEVGHPTAVNPDRTLRRVSLERGWPILTFVQPTPLLDRISPPTGVAIGVGSLLAAAGAAVIVLGGWARSRG